MIAAVDGAGASGFFGVLLVVILGHVEGLSGHYFGDDWAFEKGSSFIF